MSNTSLRRSLTQRGDQPGPMTPQTRRVYERRLARLLQRRSPPTRNQPTDRKLEGVSTELRRLLRHDCSDDDTSDDALLERLSRDFLEPTPRRKWREGNEKKSFNYLLLDPRVTRNLPARTRSLGE